MWCADSITEEDKAPKKSSSVAAVEVGHASEKTMNVVPPANKPLENMNTASELKDHSLNVKSSPTDTPPATMPNESWLQVCSRYPVYHGISHTNTRMLHRSNEVFDVPFPV